MVISLRHGPCLFIYHHMSAFVLPTGSHSERHCGIQHAHGIHWKQTKLQRRSGCIAAFQSLIDAAARIITRRALTYEISIIFFLIWGLGQTCFRVIWIVMAVFATTCGCFLWIPHSRSRLRVLVRVGVEGEVVVAADDVGSTSDVIIIRRPLLGLFLGLRLFSHWPRVGGLSLLQACTVPHDVSAPITGLLQHGT